jgi:hypothetical protein
MNVMCDKLFALCQLQLGSIVDDLEQSVEDVNAAAGRMMQDSAERASADLRTIVMGLQFHDELTQRLQHLQSLLHLLAEQDPAAEPRDYSRLLDRVARIFSSKAEFRQLDKVFPGSHMAAAADPIELF